MIEKLILVGLAFVLTLFLSIVGCNRIDAGHVGISDSKIIKARADSASLIITSQVETTAYRLKKQELNNLLIQQQFVEKWDGKLPVYGQVPELFRTISK